MFLSVQQCSYSYGRKAPVLKDISFDVERGEILAVLGRNGAGKTTLLKCLARILRWSSGHCCIDGISQGKNTVLMGYVSQRRHVPFAYEVTDVVALGRSPLNSYLAAPSRADRQAALATLERLDLGHLVGRNCLELSGGELQMVFIAKALVAEPPLLILDEPEANLDFRNQNQLVKLLIEVASQRGTAIVMNSHSLDHVSRMAHHCLLLRREGPLFGPASEVLTEKEVAHCFDTPVMALPYQWENRNCQSFVFL